MADAFGNNTVRFFSGRMRKKFRKDEIIVELFPQKIKPKYDTDPDYNRYLTWLTAHEDIEKQRDSGFHGE